MASKHNHWKRSVEMDYLSMYIKTWFAFLGTVKELHPDSISESGDGLLIREYKTKMTIPDNFESDILNYIKEVFKLGTKVIKRDIPTSYFGYFYTLNTDYKKSTDVELSSYRKDKHNQFITSDGKKTKDTLKLTVSFKTTLKGCNKNCNNLFVEVTTTQPKFSKMLKSHHISCNIMTDEFISAEHYTDSEKVLYRIIDEISRSAYDIIANDKKLKVTQIEERKGYFNGLLKELIQSFRSEFRVEHLFQPEPTSSFEFITNEEINNHKLKILGWFISFNYSLRNILFHHLIDPFDESWLELFKFAYLALQEIVNHNIKRLDE